MSKFTVIYCLKLRILSLYRQPSQQTRPLTSFSSDGPLRDHFLARQVRDLHCWTTVQHRRITKILFALHRCTSDWTKVSVLHRCTCSCERDLLPNLPPKATWTAEHELLRGSGTSIYIFLIDTWLILIGTSSFHKCI